MKLPMLRSLRHGTRRLLQARTFAAASVLTLTLGIAALTTAFTVVNAVLLRPLPYPEPDRLVSLSHTLVAGGPLHVEQTDASVLFYSRHKRAFSHFGGYRVSTAALAPADGSAAERVAAGLVTADVLPALGVTPLRGRVFTETDDRPGAAPVVMMGQGLWKRKYGADQGVLNRRIQVDGVAREVIGIMPAGLRFPASDTELWLPLQIDPAKTDSASFDYKAIARLRDGVTIEAAQSDLQALLPQLPDEFPGRLTRASIDQTRMHVAAERLDRVIVGDVGRLLLIVLGATGFVLAIAAANVGNLFLVRAESRRRAIDVQRALGASSGDVFLEFFGEALLIGVAAAFLAVLLARAGVAALQSLDAVIDLPRLAEVTIDPTTIAVAGVAALAVAFLASALATVRSRVTPGSSVPGAASRSSTASVERHRARHVLIVAQVTLALVLLAGSGLMARSVWRLRAVTPGIDPSDAIAFRLALPSATYSTPDDAVRFFLRVVDGMTNVPGVQQAGAVSKLPLDEQGRTDTAVFIADRPMAPGTLPGIHPVAYATPGYFAAAGLPVVAGRTFARPEPPRADLEVVVSRAFAQRYWPKESPLGKRVRLLFNGPWYTVVGVVGDVRDTALDRPVDQLVYCPLLPPKEDARWAPRDIAFVARTSSNPMAAAGAIREVVRGLDASLPVYRVRPLTDVVAHASARRWVTFILIGCASGVALLLGAIGLYGVMSYIVVLRTRELAIRIALGAQPHEVRRMVHRQGLRVAAIGIALGVVGAIALTRTLSTLLYEVSPTDPLVLGLAAGFLLLVSVVSNWLPTRRIVTISPVTALNAE